ncbi:MAG TPA: multidrug effflux MFS transporter [Gammaproteobacteria bacterium]|nr:multidrug effflux MFS transporter [Gammaproteobacteria bacterium]
MPRHLIVFLGALIAIGALSLDAYLPAMPAMAKSFGVDSVAMSHTISMYLVGYGLGQFFGGSFSDQIGRKRIGLIGLSIFAVAAIAIGFATTVEQVQWLRLVQAIGGGFSTVICMAIVRDVYPVEEIGRRMSMVLLTMLASPVIAPSLGAALLRFGWPTIFFFKAAYAGVLAVFYYAKVPETRPGRMSQLSLVRTLRQCAQVLSLRGEDGRRPVVYAFAMAFGAGCFMTFITNASFAYIEYFGVSPTVFPLYFGIGVVGMIGTQLYNMRHLTAEIAPRQFRVGLVVQLAAALFLAAVVVLGAHSIWFVVISVAVIVGSFGLAGPAGSSLYIRHFGALAGSASSLYTTLMFGLGSVFGVVSGFFFDGTLRPMVLTMLAAAVIANGFAVLTGAGARGAATRSAGEAVRVGDR